MEKLAETDTPIHELIGRRWSPRAFAPRAVEADKLRSVFEAARWAPSSRNEQPWAYLVATRDDAQGFDDLLGVLVEANRAWARSAPVLILALAHTRWSKDATPNRHGLYDLGQASATLAMQATALGLATHPMGGFDVQAARERFQIPSDWEPVSVIALGYPGSADDLPESLRERELAPRRRKPLGEFVMADRWGHPSPILEGR